MEIRNPVVEEFDYKYVRFHEVFNIFVPSLDCTVVIPKGFICDRESVPLFKGTSVRGGYVHDYLCRYDSVPVVTKNQAADAYFSIMEARNKATANKTSGLKKLWCRMLEGAKRYAKYWTVKVAWGYFHRHKVMASYKEITGKN